MHIKPHLGTKRLDEVKRRELKTLKATAPCTHPSAAKLHG
ncbi:MAG: hypothetical protein JSU72_13665 [Deltaproteobacteria bacterium]|nr:MAG: hypothetical protein JSU72_13665 [Deltaproteobacteria bacterium]